MLAAASSVAACLWRKSVMVGRAGRVASYVFMLDTLERGGDVAMPRVEYVFDKMLSNHFIFERG